MNQQLPNDKLDLSIVILNFRAKDKLRVALTSVFASQTKYSYEVFVVDNDSQDGSAEMVESEFPNVKLIRNPNNGFSKGNNVAIRQAAGRLILTLNPDTKLEPSVLEECINYLDAHTDIGALGCKLIKADGTLDKACRRSFPDPLNSFFRLSGLALLFPKSKTLAAYNLSYLSEDQETDVDSLTGAFMLMPKKVLDEVGLFDEEFFMYGEDLDLCYRIKQAGYRVFYYPKVITHHYKGQSSKKTPRIALLNFHRAMWIFYHKHYSEYNFFLFNWLVFAGIWLRCYALTARNWFLKEKYVSK